MDPSFARHGDLLVPSPSAVSVWSTEMVNGHQIGGLVAWAVERDHAEPDLQLSRLTIDMFRPVPMKPLRVVTRPVRAGRRIHMVDVSILDGDVEVTRASALLLRRGEQPEGLPWSPDPWDAPAPERTPPPERPPSTMPWEVRRITDWGEGRARVWIRELTELVAGDPISPLVRAAAAADFVNPLSNGAGRLGLAFINVDLTIYLARDPIGEWIGMETVGHVSSDGIGLGTAWLYDEQGRIGQCIVAALPDVRLREHGPVRPDDVKTRP